MSIRDIKLQRVVMYISFTLKKILPEYNYGLKYGLEMLIHTVTKSGHVYINDLTCYT